MVPQRAGHHQSRCGWAVDHLRLILKVVSPTGAVLGFPESFTQHNKCSDFGWLLQLQSQHWDVLVHMLKAKQS